jgi:hypothetical protein
VVALKRRREDRGWEHQARAAAYARSHAGASELLRHGWRRVG